MLLALGNADESFNALYYSLSNPKVLGFSPAASLHLHPVETKKTVDSEINRDYEYEDNDIQAILSSRLQACRGTDISPSLWTAHPLAAVDTIMPNQIRDRLTLDKEDNTGQRMLLIPCNLGKAHNNCKNAHWVGICIKFNIANEIEEALYVDSLGSGQKISAELQEQFNAVYPETRLTIRSLMKQYDFTSCGPYVVENLLLCAQNLTEESLKGKNLNADAIRQLHLDALKTNNSKFYTTFNERQKNNRPSTASLQEQLGYIKKSDKPWFSKYELQRICEICDSLANFKKINLDRLWGALKGNE